MFVAVCLGIGLVFGIDEIVICGVEMLLWLFILVIVLLF